MKKTLLIPIDTTINNPVIVDKLIKIGDTLNLTIKIYENGVSKDLSGETLDITLKKSDGRIVETGFITSIGNVINVDLGIQASNVPGDVTGEVVIGDSEGNQLTTNSFTFTVSNAVADVIIPTSADDIQTLIDLVNTISNANITLENYKQKIDLIAGTDDTLEALINIKSYIDNNLEELESKNATATVNNNNLQESISAANNTKNELDSANTQAEKNIEAMQKFGDVTNLSQNVQANTTKLNKFTEDENGDLLYNGEKISADSTADAVTTTPINGLISSNSNVQNCLELISNNVNNIKYVTGDKTYYVDGTNGSDDNDGSSVSKAFKTIEKAWSTIPVLFESNYTIKLIGTFSSDIILGGKIPLGDYCIEITSNSTSSKSNINKNFKMISLKGSPNPSFTTKATFKISYIDFTDSKITITGSQGVMISDSTMTSSSGSIDHLVDIYGSDAVISYCTLNSSSSVGVFASTFSKVYCSVLKGNVNTGYYSRYSSNITYGYNSITATTLTKTDYNGIIVAV